LKKIDSVSYSKMGKFSMLDAADPDDAVKRSDLSLPIRSKVTYNVRKHWAVEGERQLRDAFEQSLVDYCRKEILQEPTSYDKNRRHKRPERT